MALNDKQVSSARRPLRWALLAGVFLGTAGLGACSQVPDAVNPASWYRGTVDYFKGEDDKTEAKAEGGLRADRGKAPPGAEKDFPKLASVDERARARSQAGSGLSADPDRPKYAPAIPRQSESKTPPPAVARAPQPPPAVTMPPPSAAPTTPVVAQPVAPAAPEPATASATAPMTAPAEQKEQEDRLSQQLAEIRARAAAPADLPPQTELPAQGTGGTIVVSSAGIQTPGFAPTQSMPTVSVPDSAADGGTVTDTRGALPVPSHAVRVATILFADGSAKLRSADKRILGAVSRLQRQRGGTLRVVGHASARTRNLPPIRHKMANFKVSIDRADTVAGELARLGVAKESILVAAVSDTEPVYYETMPSGEAGNRRTEIYLEN